MSTHEQKLRAEHCGRIGHYLLFNRQGAFAWCVYCEKTFTFSEVVDYASSHLMAQMDMGDDKLTDVDINRLVEGK